MVEKCSLSVFICSNKHYKYFTTSKQLRYWIFLLHATRSVYLYTWKFTCLIEMLKWSKNRNVSQLWHGLIWRSMFLAYRINNFRRGWLMARSIHKLWENHVNLTVSVSPTSPIDISILIIFELIKFVQCESNDFLANQSYLPAEDMANKILS